MKVCILVNISSVADSNDLNRNIKCAPSDVEICLVIGENYFSKVEFDCIISILQAQTIVFEGERT